MFLSNETQKEANAENRKGFLILVENKTKEESGGSGYIEKLKEKEKKKQKKKKKPN